MDRNVGSNIDRDIENGLNSVVDVEVEIEGGEEI